jgi:hypothetical protein
LETKITEKQGNPEYPSLIDIEIIDGRKNSNEMYFISKSTFRLRIKEENSSKTIEGIVDSTEISSSNILDDEDVPNYITQAEKELTNALIIYLQKQSPNSKISGVVKFSEQLTYYPNPREYNFHCYHVRGYEKVYDAFDELEGNNPLEILVPALSVEDAFNNGFSLMQDIIDKKRENFKSHGMFLAEVTEVYDTDKNVLYNKEILSKT